MYNFIFRNHAIFSSNKLRTHPYSGYTLSFIELELSERFPFHEGKKSRHARNLFWSRKRRRIGSPRIVRMRQYRKPQYIAAKLHRRTWREHFSGTLNRNYPFRNTRGMLAVISFFASDIFQRHIRDRSCLICCLKLIRFPLSNWHEVLTWSINLLEHKLFNIKHIKNYNIKNLFFIYQNMTFIAYQTVI